MKRRARTAANKHSETSQFEKFRKLAEEVGCEDNDAAFDKTLKRLAETAPPETVEKRKKKR
jgi:hypothetical protein